MQLRLTFLTIKRHSSVPLSIEPVLGHKEASVTSHRSSVRNP